MATLGGARSSVPGVASSIDSIIPLYRRDQRGRHGYPDEFNNPSLYSRPPIVRMIDLVRNRPYYLRMRLAYTYWEDDGAFLGYLNEYPDYWSQGSDRNDLEEHLKDLYADLSSGEIPGIRRVGELEVA